MSKHDRIRAELDVIWRASDDRRLYAEAVVAWARNHSSSAIHAELEWDDSVAAEQHRIAQASRLIRVTMIQSVETGDQIRVWLSQPSARVHGGGYRRTEECLLDARAELRAEAIQELRRLRHRYTHLPELAPLWLAVDQAIVTYSAQAQHGQAG